MTLNDVAARVRARGLVPIRLASDPSDVDEASFWQVEGELDEFLDNVKELGAKAVYWFAYEFTEHMFEHSPERSPRFADDEESDRDTGDAEDGDEGGVAVDLVELEPRLDAYRAHVGEPYCLAFLAVLPDVNLEFDLWEPWFQKFDDLVEQLTNRLDESAEERDRFIEQAREERAHEERETLLKKLDQLLDVSAFRDLRSKAAMIAYIEEKHPETRKMLGPHNFSEKMTALYQRAQLERSRRR